jgi:Uma2 family endonuclease
MSTVAIGAEISVTQEGPPRKRWTRAECKLLQDSGLWDGQHFELIEGELYNKMGKGRPHTIALTLVRNWLMSRVWRAFIDTEPSIDVAPEDNPTSEPEPDIIVLTKPTWEFLVKPHTVRYSACWWKFRIRRNALTEDESGALCTRGHR